MIRQRIVAGLVAGVAVIGLAACGSDSTSSDTTAKAATTTEPAAATTDARPASTLPGGVTVPEMSIPDMSIPDVSIPQLTGDCAELQKGMPDLTDPSKVNQEDLDAYYAKLKAAVPADLKDDVDTVKTAFQPFYDALARANGDMTKAIQDPDAQKAMQALSDSDVSSSLQALGTWVTNGCK